ncbi:hypothetical protein SERLA73DRAFT_181578 [Serpula lacrymans var. lacrymans S7.3]|uniref:Uncharacterized protein n=2 Tax=Serpula lacrymans var. lacrymans TaxID=341189 RepID=F8PYB3_SERL3|nr:uncharacterized protein SERLADRAFT_467843 [Serpula lacrymans var. lacrymans S7.9]EGN98876.1 hypothetical protein SERLA73DRAFT_181578 [Serpula lacrymans var. lacrymans S7.3]EGO24471.1 hypothetical protein SERLADRAFT_467843 [Serpula lacrymans var. lacrymans S7.9]
MGISAGYDAIESDEERFKVMQCFLLLSVGRCFCERARSGTKFGFTAMGVDGRPECHN